MNSKTILVHPTGNTFVRALTASLLENDMLAEFHTTVTTFPGTLLEKLGQLPYFNELHRRQYDAVLKPYSHQSPWYELGRQLANMSGFRQLTRHETGPFSVDAVYRQLDRRVSKRLSASTHGPINAVYAYEDGALATFTEAKKQGIKCVYELPIAFWSTGRRLMHEEAERLPAWAITLGGGTQDSPEKLERKCHELELADLVVVPSYFVNDSLPNWAKTKQVVMAPFGTPTFTTPATVPVAPTANRPLRVLFAGSMGQRKGLGDLFDAIKLLNSSAIELVVLGSLQAPMSFYRSQLPHFTYEPGRSHADVLALMRSCDVFCLPSIVEGRALVMQEAMSQGLPLLITPNTGGHDLIQEGKTGFLIPIRSPAAIAEKLQWFLDNRAAIPTMGQLAQQHAATYTWQQYGNSIVSSINGC
ncbi:glycosyltransferase family 4 protein [Fibrella aquatilis]|uniref:Glycosyltransferase family 4 protein n=1 Tax=Fibrella aquatilis TaxID=2817059 RepID=A0A939K163_9BACT|nr:glycosyltransferase family 4 protein [Fibrella aquatilis]MBO0933188.1 glycosyltransferase family 4 protein [Fibrella aquatilis]